METIWIVTHIIAWGTGLTTGIYFSSQIEKSIDKNIKCNSCNCKKK
mgnify:FL=1